MSKRRISQADGHQALQQVQAAEVFGELPRSTRATAARFSLEELAERVPGRSVEVRVPPFGVTQCVEGPTHTRGTPPNVIETDPETWCRLVIGTIDWESAVASGAVVASGSRADLSAWLPLFDR